MASAVTPTADGARAAALVECVDPDDGDALIDGAGNRACSSDKDTIALSALRKGSWKLVGCGVRVPIDWTVATGSSEIGETIQMSVPPSGSHFAPFDFKLQVYILDPGGSDVEVTEVSEADAIEPEGTEGSEGVEDGAEGTGGSDEVEVADVDGAVTVPEPVDQVPPTDPSEEEAEELNTFGFEEAGWTRIRYLAQYPSPGEVSVPGQPVLQEDVPVIHAGGAWMSTFGYQSQGAKDISTTMFECSARDDMSIETFSSLCSITVERMTLKASEILIGQCDE